MAGITTSIETAFEIERGAIPIPGLTVHPLVAHADARGVLTEFFRSSWGMETMSQWTAMTLESRVVRGPTVHPRHLDAMVVVSGEMELGLRDLRESSPVFRRPYRLTLRGREPALILIPPGVMHTFLARAEPAVVIVGTTHEYDPDDDIRCRWQDGALDIDGSEIGTDDDRARSLDEVIAALRGRG